MVVQKGRTVEQSPGNVLGAFEAFCAKTDAFEFFVGRSTIENGVIQFCDHFAVIIFAGDYPGDAVARVGRIKNKTKSSPELFQIGAVIFALRLILGI